VFMLLQPRVATGPPPSTGDSLRWHHTKATLAIACPPTRLSASLPPCLPALPASLPVLLSAVCSPSRGRPSHSRHIAPEAHPAGRHCTYRERVGRSAQPQCPSPANV